MDTRKIEKTQKYGYIFFVKYDGRKFDCFDENPGKKSVKREFKERMNKLGITWAKGIQQAGRTDAGVSADENILYISSKFNGNIGEIVTEFNKMGDNFLIKSYKKSLPDLVIPELVERRIYNYEYPIAKINMTKDEIDKKCKELSGKYDVSEFTDAKGEKLKEKEREVHITYDGEIFEFVGNSFMPKQIRIMVGFIVFGKKRVLSPKPLTFKKVILKPEVEELIFKTIDKNDFLKEYIKFEHSSINVWEKSENGREELEELRKLMSKVEKLEKVGDVFVFYINNDNRSEFIGKNGANIKRIRKIIKDMVVVKDV